MAQNEADHISAAVRSLSFADEIIVIDGGSTDDTVELARAAGARVIHHPWPGFAAQLRFALSHATGDWVFRLDADEVVSPQLQAEILHILSHPERPEAAFWVPEVSVVYGRRMYHSSLYPDPHLRLSRRGEVSVPERAVHEAPEPNDPEAKIGRLRCEITHYPWRNLDDMVRKVVRNSRLQAEGVILSGRRRRWPALLMLIAFPRKFCEFYLIKLGILDGYPGFIIAVVHAFQVFLRECRIWLHQSGLTDASNYPQAHEVQEIVVPERKSRRLAR